MKRLAILCLCAFLPVAASSQVIVPRVPDASTMALWHLDESNPGTITDASTHGLTGYSVGTSVVNGRAGAARSFNGVSDYITVPDPPNGELDFSSMESFTVECWFKTSSPKPMELIRKGLAPAPGYTLLISAGKVVGIIGNRDDGTPPDALVIITSDATYNDGEWHHAMLIRDRAQKRLRLNVDGKPAAAPIADTFPYALASDRPLTIGRWEENGLPYFFEGVIDEVCITRDSLRTQLFTPLMAAWNFDHDSTGGIILDSSANANTGIATGTTVTAGVTGLARYFNGSGDYIGVDDPWNGSLDFDTSQSFTVEAWFKTTSAAPMQVLRKGLAPEPGYGLFVSGGYVDAVIGNREDGQPPDTLLIMHSVRLYNDGMWHRIALVRDRSTHKVCLYVDEKLATIPYDDDFPKAIASDRPLTIGRWESGVYPTYYQGALDRIAITRGALHPASSPTPGLLVRMEPLDHGSVIVGDSVDRRLTVYNTGTRDTLFLSGIGAAPSVFSPRSMQLAVRPRDTASITIRYRPSAIRRDSGWVTFQTNDPGSPTVQIDLLGRGIAAGPVTLVSPLNFTTISKDTIAFIWRKSTPAPTKYWFEWSLSGSFTPVTVDSALTDTLTRKSGFPKNSTIYWRVRAGTQAGWGEYSASRTVFRDATSVPEAPRPSTFALHPNYPNPFNPSTTITFRLPEASVVRLEIFNAAGELMRVATEGYYPPGEYRIVFDGTGLPSGTYFARMRTGTASMVRPMLLMK